MTGKDLDLLALVTDPAIRVVVTCGSGGVGKTTTAAAMAVAAADAGRTVAVLTIDPARRLAQSLGLGELDNTPRLVNHDGSGKLFAMMLDTRRTFDDMVAAHTSPERAEQIYAEPVLQDHLHLVLRHPGVHGDGEARPPVRRRASTT